MRGWLGWAFFWLILAVINPAFYGLFAMCLIMALAMRDSDGSPQGRDREDGLDGEAATARAEGIAHPPPLSPKETTRD